MPMVVISSLISIPALSIWLGCLLDFFPTFSNDGPQLVFPTIFLDGSDKFFTSGSHIELTGFNAVLFLRPVFFLDQIIDAVANVVNAEGWVNIKVGKGGKERVVPVGSVVQKSLWKYINHFRPQPLTQKVTRLFLSEDGLPITRSGIQQMLRRCGKRAGVSGVRCSPHTFRHTFAKSYLVNGGDIFSLQKILGHLEHLLV